MVVIRSYRLPGTLLTRQEFYVLMSFRCPEVSSSFQMIYIYFNKVTDIADAMILRRLLESLLNYGVVFVVTSK